MKLWLIRHGLTRLGEALEKQVKKFSLRLTAEATENESAEVKLSLRSEEKDVLSLALNAAPIDAFEIEMPAEALDPDTWTQNMEMNGLSDVLSKLIEAGFPTSLLENLGSLMTADA